MMKSPYVCEQVSQQYCQKTSTTWHLWSGPYRRETISVKHESMQQLAKSERLQHPAAEPPRPLPQPAILFPAPNHTSVLHIVPAKLQRTECCVDGNGDAKLLRRVDPKGQTRRRRSNGGCVHRCDDTGQARVSLPPRLGGRLKNRQPESREEAEEETIEQQDRTEG